MANDAALTWNDLANMYDRKHGAGRPARTLRMETVMDWALRQDNIEVREDDCLYLKTTEPTHV